MSVYPSPGTPTASPRTQISLRGLEPDELGAIEVSGSRSGAHAGRLEPHPDGEGASFVPERPFEPGEEVTVETELSVHGSADGRVRFAIARPAPYGRPFAQRRGKGTPGDVRRFRSRPDLRPPTVTVTRREPGAAPGYVFLAPKRTRGQDGPMIVDDRGEPVYLHPLDGEQGFDFRVQRFRGRPVLTWWEGTPVAPGYGLGEGVIVDASYRPIARVRAGNGYRADLHDFRLTDRGTALMTIYSPVRADLSSAGGVEAGVVLDQVVQEVDVETGLVLFEWHSLGHVGLDESYSPPPDDPDRPYDYFHLNSIDEQPDGDLLVSARNTWAGYELDRETGAVKWRLSGRRSSVRMRPGARFAWQHDIRAHPDGTITILDNAASPAVRTRSRGITLALDRKRSVATLAHEYEHPGRVLASSQANMQALPGGNVLIGWGSVPRISEFREDGRLVWDARLPLGGETYNAFRMPWTGRPRDRPAIATRARDGHVTVYASWNGATEVARWQVVAGPAPRELEPVRSRRRTGFETAVRVRAPEPWVAVRALDRAGNVLGTSMPARAR